MIAWIHMKLLKAIRIEGVILNFLEYFCYSQRSILEVLTATSILMQEKKIYKSKKWLDFRVCQILIVNQYTVLYQAVL